MGKIKEPGKSIWEYRELVERKVQEKLAGKDYKEGMLSSEEGKAALSEAEAEATEQLGYSYADAEREHFLEDIEHTLKYSQEKTAKEELDSNDCCSVVP